MALSALDSSTYEMVALVTAQEQGVRQTERGQVSAAITMVALVSAGGRARQLQVGLRSMTAAASWLIDSASQAASQGIQRSSPAEPVGGDST